MTRDTQLDRHTCACTPYQLHSRLNCLQIYVLFTLLSLCSWCCMDCIVLYLLSYQGKKCKM